MSQGSQASLSAAALGRRKFGAVVRLLRFGRNAVLVSRHFRVALAVIDFLIERGGVSDLSEIRLAQAVGHCDKSVRLALSDLEAAGALDVRRRSAGGLRLSSVRSLDLSGTLDFLKLVLSGGLSRAALSVAAMMRRAIGRSFRPRPSGDLLQNCHTVMRRAEGLNTDFLERGVGQKPVRDASQVVADHVAGRLALSAAALAAALAEAAAAFGLSVAEYSRLCGLQVADLL